ncbi:MAG TPA: hypothetical protein VMH28_03335 [Candidatus Acidoferrales bacterium]|nr:hypothetical protein [Candidatus Acidoferrales bacterium]
MTFGKHYFEYENLKYFRDDAHDTTLGAFGEKKDPIGAASHLDVAGHIAPSQLEGSVRCTAAIDVDLKGTTKSDFEGDVGLKVFSAGASVAKSTTYANAASFKLVEFVIDQEPLRRILNNGATAALKYLANEGHDGRCVSGIWVMTDNKVATAFKTATTVSVSASPGGNSISFTAKNGSTSLETITVADATFAYTLQKVQDWNKDKTQIVKLEYDWKGNG